MHTNSEFTIIIDFDGTITTEDVSEYILHHFADGDWKSIEEKAIAGQISMNECMVQQYGMIRGHLHDIMLKSREIGIREGFIPFADFAKKKDLEMICVSAGLSFIIEDVFDTLDLDIPVVSPTANHTESGIDLDLIPVEDKYIDFKHQEVDKAQSEGKSVIYIGDGSSDFGGARFADFIYTVSNSSLTRLCEQENLDHYEFTSFHEILDHLETVVSAR